MTDTVTVSRELLRQVLEAVNSYPHRHLTPSIAATRVALRAALEQPAPVQEPIGYLAFRDGKPSWDEDCVCEDAVYPVDADDDRVSVAIYTAPQPDRIAQLEAANTNLFEQGQKMHKRIQELERDCKIGAQEMVKAYEEIDNLKAQMFMHEPVTDEENERFSRDVSNFKGSDPEATKYALEAFLRNRVQTAPVQEQQPVAWMHVMDNTEGHKANGTGVVSITQKRKHPFGKPGVDFSKSYPVTSTSLFAAQPRKAAKLSDDEIQDAINSTIGIGYRHLDEFARAIEAAVWAKLGVEP